MARAKRTTRRVASTAPITNEEPEMASLGTVSVTGPSSFTTGEAQTFTASITSKLDTSVLTWEGVGFDLFDADTGGLSGDQNHDEAIVLTFTTPGEYTIKAGYSDVAADNSPQYSQGYVLTVSVPAEPGEPLTMKTESVLSGEPFIGKVLTLTPGTAQGGEEPYNEAYSWEAGTDGSWDAIDGYAGTSYSLGETEKGKSVRAVTTITDAKGAVLRLATLGTGIVDKEPEQIVEGGELSGNAQYQAASILYWYRRWHNRDFLVTPVDSSTFTLAPAGKLGDQGKLAYTPTEGEKKLVTGWLADRWDGDISVEGTTITLTCVGGGNFHPSGGGSPRSLTVA